MLIHLYLQKYLVKKYNYEAESVIPLRCSNLAHSKLWYTMVRENLTIEMPQDGITSQYRFDRSFEACIPTRYDWNENRVIPTENCTFRFTDGSKIYERTVLDTTVYTR